MLIRKDTQNHTNYLLLIGYSLLKIESLLTDEVAKVTSFWFGTLSRLVFRPTVAFNFTKVFYTGLTRLPGIEAAVRLI